MTNNERYKNTTRQPSGLESTGREEKARWVMAMRAQGLSDHRAHPPENN